jgi:hypothetical protein
LSDDLIKFREKMEMLKKREAEISVSSDLRIRKLQAV